MSQRMEFDETNRQQQEPPNNTYQSGYQDPFMGSSGQKISFSNPSSSPSTGARLALAIVSVCILIPITGIIMGTSISSGAGAIGLIGGLIGLGLICLTIMVVNFAFNFRR